VDANGVQHAMSMMQSVAAIVPYALVACATYLATVAVGVAAVRGQSVRRKWHTRLFTVTTIVTALAATLALLRASILEGVALLAALVPLGLLPFVSVPVSTHTRRHALIAACAAPCYLAAIVFRAAEAS